MSVAVYYHDSDPCREARAIRDIADYLGPERLALVWEAVQAEPSRHRKVHLAGVLLSFAGVRGFPVRAYCRAVLSLS